MDISLTEFLGLPEEEARALAGRKGYVWRIVAKDGKVMKITQDQRHDRINFKIKNSIVYDAYVG